MLPALSIHVPMLRRPPLILYTSYLTHERLDVDPFFAVMMTNALWPAGSLL